MENLSMSLSDFDGYFSQPGEGVKKDVDITQPFPMTDKYYKDRQTDRPTILFDSCFCVK